jgi:hypothetical protein
MAWTGKVANEANRSRPLVVCNQMVNVDSFVTIDAKRTQFRGRFHAARLDDPGLAVPKLECRNVPKNELYGRSKRTKE